MELRVNEVQLPAPITFNYEELKQEIVSLAEQYRGMVYTDEQIDIAKADKARLNKLKKALNDERIRQEADYMKPFLTFKSQIAEIIGIIDEPVAIIDKQLKEYDEQRKKEKLKAIHDAFMGLIDRPEWLDLEQIYDPRWMNKTYNMTQIKADMQAWLNKIKADLSVIEGMDECTFEMKLHYHEHLDLTGALAEGRRQMSIQKRKEEEEAARKMAEEAAQKAKEEAGQKAQEEQPKAEAAQQAEQQAEQPVEETRMWVSFRAYMTVKQAMELREFFSLHGIKIERA